MLSIDEIRTMPKVELHRHLEGSIRPATLLELALGYGVQRIGHGVNAMDNEGAMKAHQEARCVDRGVPHNQSPRGGN